MKELNEKCHTFYCDFSTILIIQERIKHSKEDSFIEKSRSVSGVHRLQIPALVLTWLDILYCQTRRIM